MSNNVIRRNGKISTSSKCNGISIANSNGKFFAIFSHDSIGSSVNFDVSIEKPERPPQHMSGTAYNANLSCGSLSGNSTEYAIPQQKTKENQALQASSGQSLLASTPNPEPEEQCPEQPLILAAPDGYYALSYDYATYDFDAAKIISLGSNPTGDCVKRGITRLDAVAIPHFSSNSMPSRWAWNDGVRKHCIPTEFNYWSAFPMTATVELQNELPGPGRDNTFIPQYGYDWGMYLGYGTAGYAKLGGCGVNNAFAWFSKESMIVYIKNVDWTQFDAYSWDFSHCPEGGRFVSGLEFNRSCPSTPTFASGDFDARLTDLLNHDRYCVEIVGEVILDEDASNVAQAYADRMALYGFMQHQDPYDGSFPEDRMTSADVEFEIVTEVLAVVPHQEKETYVQTVDAISDSLWAAWKSSYVHYSGLMTKDRYRIGWGVAQAAGVNGLWYGCGLIFKKETDLPPELEATNMIFPKLPLLFLGEEHHFLSIFMRSNGYGAFSTAPREKLGLSCTARAIFDGVLDFEDGIITRVKNHEVYGITWDPIEKIEPFPFNPVIPDIAVSDDPIEIEQPMFYTLHGTMIRRHDGESVNFYIQYDNLESDAYNKSIKVELDSHNAEFPDWNETIIPKEQYFRTTPLLLENETEPQYTSSGLQGGECRLLVGTIPIDSTSHYYRGPYTNPYSDLMVGSVFFTNSGYTALTYSLPKLLNMTRRKWDLDEGEFVNEYYWWLKQEFWAAVLDPLGTKIAQWRLGGPPAEYDLSGFYQKTHEEYIDIAGKQAYYMQPGPEIKKGTASVYCIVDGLPFYLQDSGEGFFTEMKNQIPGYEHILASSKINYSNGTVNIIFGPKTPDVGTILYLYAKVSNVQPYAYYEIFSEVARYEGRFEYFDNYQLSGEGFQPATPNLTITEDGKYAIFSARTYKYKITSASQRLGYGDPFELDTANLLTNEPGNSKMFCVAFDLQTMEELMVPKRLSNPLFLNANQGDAMILN